LPIKFVVACIETGRGIADDVIRLVFVDEDAAAFI
jgi:hypothetical protein